MIARRPRIGGGSLTRAAWLLALVAGLLVPGQSGAAAQPVDAPPLLESPAARVVFGVLLLLCALALLLVGGWGLRHAPGLVPSTLSEAETARKVRVLRRGARVSMATGVATLFCAVAILFLLV